MSKIKIATAWLDSCAGCHMSVLDVDEAIAVVAQKARHRFRPPGRRAQEVPGALTSPLSKARFPARTT